MLAALIAAEGVEWPRVRGFHLDEYLGLPPAHPASFRRYLKERLVDRVPFGAFHYLGGESDALVDDQTAAAAECRRAGALLRAHPIDVALVGIGENGHLAFNDPPADFETDEPYIVVALDEACRRQQFGEGWFPTFDAVPTRDQHVDPPDHAFAGDRVQRSRPPQSRRSAHGAGGPVTPQVPASILQQHPEATIYLDRAAAELLTSAAG